MNLSETSSEDLSAALRDCLAHPHLIRSLAASDSERELLAAKIRELRISALRGAAPVSEELCLEALLHLRHLDLTDRMRLAYLWAIRPDQTPRFAAASLYGEYLARSRQSTTPYEAHAQVEAALHKMLQSNPPWKPLLQAHLALRKLNAAPSSSG